MSLDGSGPCQALLCMVRSFRLGLLARSRGLLMSPCLTISQTTKRCIVPHGMQMDPREPLEATLHVAPSMGTWQPRMAGLPYQAPKIFGRCFTTGGLHPLCLIV